MADKEQHEHADFNEAGSSHVLEWTIYLKVFGILVVLMVATIVAARVNLGPLNNIIAMTIAVTKAALVVLYFMQVRYSSKLTWIWAGIGFIWLAFLFGTLGDYLTRDWLFTRGWQTLH